MRAIGKQDYSTRLRIKDVSVPLTTYISVIDGHVDLKDVPDRKDQSLICHGVLDRSYKAEHVIKQPVRIGRIRGTLFIPHGNMMKILITVSTLKKYTRCNLLNIYKFLIFCK